MKLTVRIEKGRDGMFSAWAKSLSGKQVMYGYGESVADAKRDFLRALENSWMSLQDDYELVYKYDLPSFFDYYDFINAAALARMAGINPSQMRQYRNGLARPSARTIIRIKEVLSVIASDLSRTTL